MIVLLDEYKILYFLLLLLLTIFMIIHSKYVKPALARGSRLLTVEATGQVLTLPSPKSVPWPVILKSLTALSD